MIINIKFDEQDDNAIELTKHIEEYIDFMNKYKCSLCTTQYKCYDGISDDGIVYAIHTRKTKNGFNILIKKEE